MGFLGDIFSFRNCHYTTVEELSDDIMKQVTVRTGNTITKLSEKR